MPLSFSELKLGSVIEIDGQPYQIVWQNFQRTAQRKPVLQTKLKNLITGRVLEYSFKFGEKIEEADVARTAAQFLYLESNTAYFMDNVNFETVSLPESAVADSVAFLRPGLDCSLVWFAGRPVKLELPIKVRYTITSTTPGIRGDTATGGMKAATIESGASIQVPLFVEEGEEVIVNTTTGQYVERANK